MPTAGRSNRPAAEASRIRLRWPERRPALESMMARFWREPYTEEKARLIGIHDYEGALVLGQPGTRWIYHVEVCKFTFAFFSMRMIQEYLDYYSRKLLRSSRLNNPPFSLGAPPAVNSEGQTRFERLPLQLIRPRSQSIVLPTKYQPAGLPAS